MTKWDLSLGCKDGSTYANKCDIVHEQNEKQKSHAHPNRRSKSMKNLTHFHGKNSKQVRCIRN